MAKKKTPQTKPQSETSSSKGLSSEMITAMDHAAQEIVDENLTNAEKLERTVFGNSILYLYKEKASNLGLRIFLKDDGKGEINQVEFE